MESMWTSNLKPVLLVEGRFDPRTELLPVMDGVLLYPGLLLDKEMATVARGTFPLRFPASLLHLNLPIHSSHLASAALADWVAA